MKKVLREKGLNIRNNLSIGEVKSKSNLIINNIKETFDLKKYNTLGFYMPLGKEVDLRPLIEELLQQGKTIVIPKVLDKYHMDFFPIKDLNDYNVGRFNVLEPTSNKKMPRDNIEIIFVPGIYFSDDKYRLGFGAGYYDRYLAAYSGIKVGVCFDFQHIPDLPIDDYDIPMDLIITENPSHQYRDED